MSFEKLVRLLVDADLELLGLTARSRAVPPPAPR
jgi:hypothetical protein